MVFNVLITNINNLCFTQLITFSLRIFMFKIKKIIKDGRCLVYKFKELT